MSPAGRADDQPGLVAQFCSERVGCPKTERIFEPLDAVVFCSQRHPLVEVGPLHRMPAFASARWPKEAMSGLTALRFANTLSDGAAGLCGSRALQKASDAAPRAIQLIRGRFQGAGVGQALKGKDFKNQLVQIEIVAQRTFPLRRLRRRQQGGSPTSLRPSSSSPRLKRWWLGLLQAGTARMQIRCVILCIRTRAI